MSSDHVERVPLSQWHAQHLRLTLFTGQPTIAPAQLNWWEPLVGEPPLTRNIHPREQVLEESGPVALGELKLRVEPGRIDWLLGPILAGPEPGAPSIAEFEKALSFFHSTIKAWLPNCPPVTRIAFGAIAELPVGERTSGYRQLIPYLSSVKIEPEASRDFFYSINRPRISTTVAGLEINRLSKWAVGLYRQFMTQGATMSVTSEQHTVRIEVDINTTPEPPRDLPKESLDNLFDELVSLGVEILVEGDVK